MAYGTSHDAVLFCVFFWLFLSILLPSGMVCLPIVCLRRAVGPGWNCQPVVDVSFEHPIMLSVLPYALFRPFQPTAIACSSLPSLLPSRAKKMASSTMHINRQRR